ncbi:hypothetical protein MUU53_14005 [Rhizobium lemnae]|uniref:Uncharacterized protein n=1 Tax=Rhizobium lemnae TaxID=1214924 RepID=A0ABV8EAY9_9HYPH|nr:hypothetical protein [Rhizobium lemnae]MCJ8509027.1 hypothetical protein [Rhizobium lemnae]
MTITRTQTYNGKGDLFDGLENSISAIKAAAALIEIALRREESLKQEAHGVWCLIKSQCDDAEFFTSALTDEMRNIERSKLSIRDPKEIAAMTALPTHIVCSVVHAATGVLLGSCAPEWRKQDA